MKSDAIVIGVELDGLIAALRLLEAGFSVRIFGRGGGSLHYAPGGIHALGFGPLNSDEPLSDPIGGIEELDPQHPYRLLGSELVGRSLDWFLTTSAKIDLRFTSNGHNQRALTPAGLSLPVFAPYQTQATLNAARGKKCAVVQFHGHRNYTAGLVAKGLSEMGSIATLVDLDPPGGQAETVAMAFALDHVSEPASFFQDIACRVPPGTEVVLFPAMLGLDRHLRVMDAAAALSCHCLEIPTLPPSVPGMRLIRAFERQLHRGCASVHQIAKITVEHSRDDRVLSLVDERGHRYEAEVFILANGGILMGGLEIDSYGRVYEPIFDLEVFQTAPISSDQIAHALDALHRTGIEVDGNLQPRSNGVADGAKIFVTGGMLAHWNPMQEASAEGVSIATGWAAAEAAKACLRGH